MWGWLADGASVNNVRRAFSGPGGENLAQRHEVAIGRELLSVHCAPHRLLLSTSKAWAKGPYLVQVDNNISRLHNHFTHSRNAHVDFGFTTFFTNSQAFWRAVA